jgi:hypothetical protein
MQPLPEVIDELRALFKKGATPSRLIRQIAERHEGETPVHALVQTYFREAFGVEPVRGLNPLDTFQNTDLRYSFLNTQLLYEMIQKKSTWENRGESEPESWLDSLRVIDVREPARQARGALAPELERCWKLLNSDEREFLLTSMASANGLFELVRILALLAESLQQRITELEAAPQT